MTRRVGAKQARGERVAVPAEMKAAAIDKFGPASALTLHTVPVPRPGPTEVLIAVHAAGVGMWDVSIRDGTWAEGDIHFPLIMGMDGAGEIIEVGERVRRLQLGDRVWSYQYGNKKGGFYAEYVVVDADNASPVPRGLTMLEAGAGAVTALTALTALQGFDDHLALRRDETVLIFGASGAVGTLAVQFAARYRRARVIAIASGTKARTLLEKLGAEAVIDGRRRDARARIAEVAPDGLDAVLALAASPMLAASIDLGRPGGRVAYPNGVEPAPRKRAGIRVKGYDAEVNRAALQRLGRAAEAAKLEVPIDASYPLARASQAHKRVERGHVVGRVVLRIR